MLRNCKLGTARMIPTKDAGNMRAVPSLRSLATHPNLPSTALFRIKGVLEFASQSLSKKPAF